MLIRKNIIYIALISTIVLLTYLLACKSGDTTSYEQKIWWVEKPHGGFLTNDIEKAQSEIPFDIILPGYLPDGLDPLPWIEGPLKKDYENYDMDRITLCVYIKYQKRVKEGYKYLVYIEERDSTVNVEPTLDARSLYLDFNGVKVLKQEGLDCDLFQSDPVYTSYIDYYWNQNDRHFYVQVRQYGLDEGRKIVESMVLQLEP